MKNYRWILFLSLFGTQLSFGQDRVPEPIQSLKKQLTFLATFDDGFDADFAAGSRKALTASDAGRSKIESGMKVPGVQRVENGKYGSAIQFTKKTKQVFTYAGKNNFPYSKGKFDATVSFWIKADPKALPKGFIDPLQITDKKWNDASIFVDFEDKTQNFRMGVFSDFQFWNPDNKKYELFSPADRPLVDAGNQVFQPGRWTHIALVFADINAGDSGKKTEPGMSRCELHIDGKLIGTLKRRQKFSWDPEKVMMMLGIYFVGEMDDFAIFGSSLSSDQIQSIRDMPESLKVLTR